MENKRGHNRVTSKSNALYELNMLQNFSSEQKEYLRELAENTYAENWVNALRGEIKSQKITEAEAFKSVNTIPYKSVRGIAQKKLEKELHIMGLQKREEKKNALMAAMNAFKAVINTDVPESEKLQNFYTLSREAKKRAKEGKDADSIFYNALQGHLQKHTTFSPYFSKTLKKK